MNRLIRSIVLASMTLAAAPSLTALAQEPPTFQQIVQPYVDQGRFAGANGVVDFWNISSGSIALLVDVFGFYQND